MSALRLIVLSLALSAPFAAVAYAAAALVPALSQRAVNALLAVAAPLVDSPAAAPHVVTPEPPAELEPALLPVAGNGKSRQRAGVRPSAPAKPTALFVSQATVLKLAESAARPRGEFVPETAEHPAGLRLAGVGGLGIGAQDGDILIEALGISPRAAGDIIGAVIEARAKNVRFLSGTLWRRGTTFPITVEQPYLPSRP